MAEAGQPGVREWPQYRMEEVARHCRKDDAWIVVRDQVYNMTAHVLNHEGWTSSGKISTLLAILGAMGQDCTEDFEEVHSPAAWAMLSAFQIGVLETPNVGRRRATMRTWEQLEEAGLV